MNSRKPYIECELCKQHKLNPDTSVKEPPTPASINPKNRKKMTRQLIHMLRTDITLNEFEQACCDEWKLSKDSIPDPI